jgi:signal transduction histidine kinase
VVDDEGPGVLPAERERIFERFARGSGARRRGSGGGSGLGLALVREHVEVHGGVVRVEDRPGGGARFVVELPVMPE